MPAVAEGSYEPASVISSNTFCQERHKLGKKISVLRYI